MERRRFVGNRLHLEALEGAWPRFLERPWWSALSVSHSSVPAASLAELRSAQGDAKRVLHEVTPHEVSAERDHALGQCIARLELALSNACPQHMAASATPHALPESPSRSSKTNPHELAETVVGGVHAADGSAPNAPEPRTHTECLVCCDQLIDPAHGISCAYGHQICPECTTNLVRIECDALGGRLTELANGRRAGVICCPFCRDSEDHQGGVPLDSEVLAGAFSPGAADMVVAAQAQVVRHRTALLEDRLTALVEDAAVAIAIADMDPSRRVLLCRAAEHRWYITTYLLTPTVSCPTPGCGCRALLVSGSLDVACSNRCGAHFCGACGTNLRRNPGHIHNGAVLGRQPLLCRLELWATRVAEYLKRIDDPREVLEVIAQCQADFSDVGIELEILTSITCKI